MLGQRELSERPSLIISMERSLYYMLYYEVSQCFVLYIVVFAFSCSINSNTPVNTPELITNAN